MKDILYSFRQAINPFMKKTSILFVLILLSAAVTAQQRPYPTVEDAEKFKNQ